MEPEGSLPHSQVPLTCPYPEPDRPSPCPHIPLPEDPSKLLIMDFKIKASNQSQDVSISAVYCLLSSK
jgi:hypothetical protein